MATQYVEYSAVGLNRQFSWSGVFSGAFLFLAIEATFGVLGIAIFTSAIDRSANPASRGIGIGAGIWMVVLSIIALYFAGKLASKYSATTTRNSGMYAGLVTFGVSIFTTLLIAGWAFGNIALVNSGATGGVVLNIMDFIVAGGYWLFATLVLGMIAAASGGIHGSMMSGLQRAEQRTIDATKRAA